nr:hypothetical protein [Kofleriaceae bacterium]
MILVAVVASLAGRTARADPATLGVDAVGVAPVGAYSDVSTAAFGADARIAYPVTSSVAAIGRVGYVQDANQMAGFSMSIVPVLVGARVRLGASHVFVDAELGASVITESGMGTSLTNARFGFQLGAGYQAGKLEAKLGYWVPGSEDLGNGRDSTLGGVVASVGYDFIAL